MIVKGRRWGSAFGGVPWYDDREVLECFAVILRRVAESSPIRPGAWRITAIDGNETVALSRSWNGYNYSGRLEQAVVPETDLERAQIERVVAAFRAWTPDLERAAVEEDRREKVRIYLRALVRMGIPIESPPPRGDIYRSYLGVDLEPEFQPFRRR